MRVSNTSDKKSMFRGSEAQLGNVAAPQSGSTELPSQFCIASALHLCMEIFIVCPLRVCLLDSLRHPNVSILGSPDRLEKSLSHTCSE